MLTGLRSCITVSKSLILFVQIVILNFQFCEMKYRRMLMAFPKIVYDMPKFEKDFAAHCLAPQDTDVLFASYQPGEKIPLHSHDTYNFGVITKGAMIIEMEEGETKYGTGDWFMIPKKTLHAARF